VLLLRNCGHMITSVSFMSRRVLLLLIMACVGCETRPEFDPHRKRWEPEFASTGWHTKELTIDLGRIKAAEELPATTMADYRKDEAWLPKRTRLYFNDGTASCDVLEGVDEIIIGSGFKKFNFIEEDRECINMDDPNAPIF
jgi:hypothetical protein